MMGKLTPREDLTLSSDCDCSYCCSDKTLCAVFAIDPAGVTAHLFDLYHQRCQQGHNVELQTFSDTILLLADWEECVFPWGPSETLERRDSHSIGRGSTEEAVNAYGVRNFCSLVMSQDDFYQEDPAFFNSVLTLARLVFLPVTWFNPDPLVVALATMILDGIWDQRSVLRVIRQMIGQHIDDICKSLIGLTRTLTNLPDLGTHPSLQLSMQKACLVCWILNPYLDHIADTYPEDEDSSFIYEDDRCASGMFLWQAMGGHKESPSKDSIEASTLHLILPEYGPQLFLERLAETLCNPGSQSGWHAFSAFSVVAISVLASPLLVASPVLPEVLDAMYEAIEGARSSENPENTQIVMGELNVLCLMMTPSGHSNPDGLPAIMSISRGGRIFEVLIMSLHDYFSQALSYHHFSDAYKSFSHCVDRIGKWALAIDRYKAKHPVRKAMRGVFRCEWFPTLQLMREHRPQSTLSDAHSSLIRLWEELGLNLHLEEPKKDSDRTRETHKAGLFCAWKGCPNHFELPAGLLYHCKGCGEAKYCCRACQIHDWKAGHKLRCKRLTA